MIEFTRRGLLTSTALLALTPKLAIAGKSPHPLSLFADPPRAASPWCYWYWISENISREGISRDLEAMRDIGIAEALIGIIQEQAPPGPMKTLSDDWWGAVVHAVSEGARTGVDLGFFNSPGWSQSGGPWIKSEQSMRYIVSSELRVKGPKMLRTKLAQPAAPFQDVALLAYPAPREDGIWLKDAKVTAEPPLQDAQRLISAEGAGASFDPKLVGSASIMEGRAFLGRSEDRPGLQRIEILADEPFTARSLTLVPLPVPVRADVVLSAGDEGKMVEVARFTFDRRNSMKSTGPMVYGPVAIAFPPVTARRFELTFSRIGGDKGCGLSQVHLGATPLLDHYVEKQLGKMHQTPSPEWDSYHWTPQEESDSNLYSIAPATILDISDRLSSDGALTWDVPHGDWIIQRSGMTPTGVVNAPAPPSATGYEVDKMNAEALAFHFDAYVGELLRRLPTRTARSALKHVVADSYETGSQNWTDGFERVFQARYGYDPKRWLPVLTGRLVGSADQSERFLWDLRRLVADRIATEYVGALRRLSHKRGLGLWLENYGHWGFPAEFLQYGGQSDRLGGEFWMQGDFTMEISAPVSAAALYGKSIVSAEAFTSGQPWLGHPRSLKTRGDWAFANGINHFVLHVNIHQPTEAAPGINAGFGTEFNRLNTWFMKAGAWIDYIRRTSHLLQQGVRVAEFAYFIGEDTPSATGPSDPKPPPGFSWIFINAEVIEAGLKVRNGRFILPEGVSFAVLVLPKLRTMRPSLLRALTELMRQGGIVVGDLPSHSPSLAAYPAADTAVRAIGAKLSDSTHLIPRGDLGEALSRAGAHPSVGSVPSSVLWSHRHASFGDLFYFSNQSDDPVNWKATLRAKGGQPVLCDPVTGGTAGVKTSSRSDGWVSLGLALPARGALFVVVPRTSVRSDHAASVFNGYYGPPFVQLQGSPKEAHERGHRVITGPWQVHFPTLAVPDRNFDDLISWSDHPDPAIRFFSGSATYRRDLNMENKISAKTRVLLDLGRVDVIAAVKLNGVSCGTVWCDPGVVDITNALKPGRNRLEVEVTNLWYNRLVARESATPIPGLKDQPWTAIKSGADPTQLQPGGLVGPVSLREVELS